MAKVIHKYEVPPGVRRPDGIGRVCTVELPIDAEILTADVQYGRPVIWALVDPDAAKRPIRFLVLLTGDPMPYDVVHFGSFMLRQDFVVHFFGPLE